MSFGGGIDPIWQWQQRQQQRPPNFEQEQDLFRAFFFTTQRFLNYLIRNEQSVGKGQALLAAKPHSAFSCLFLYSKMRTTTTTKKGINQ